MCTMKNLKSLLFISLALAASSLPALADCIPYCQIGTIAPTKVITAQADGDVTGRFFNYSADFADSVRVVDVTQNWTSAWSLDNKTSHSGDTVTFGAARAGDLLVVELWDQVTNMIYASEPDLSADGKNHAYVVGGNFFGKPSAFVGLEDLRVTEATDWDYNDHEFFLFNVSVANSLNTIGQFGDDYRVATPEPTSLVLMGVGLVSVFRKARRSKA